LVFPKSSPVTIRHPNFGLGKERKHVHDYIYILYIYFHSSIHLSIYLFIYLSFFLSFFLSYLSIYVSIYVFIDLFIIFHLFIFLFHIYIYDPKFGAKKIGLHHPTFRPLLPCIQLRCSSNAPRDKPPTRDAMLKTTPGRRGIVATITKHDHNGG
jgi:hypothetical protein